MSDDLVERVARLYEDKWGVTDHGLARAAIAVCMEEAAKVAEDSSFLFIQNTPITVVVVDVRHTIAAAIRALIKEPQP